MIRNIIFAVVLSAVASFGAQGSGIFLEGHVSRGVMGGDQLLAGVTEMYGTPVEYQYNVRYALSAGYEQSFNKVISLRGGIGYQNVLMDAYAGTYEFDLTEVATIDAQIDRHWLTIPIDFKATLPFGRSGVYIAIGPKASILLSSTFTDNLDNTTSDLTDDTPRFNLAIGGNFGIEFPIANAGHLFIESGYHQGLLNTSPDSSLKIQESEINFLKVGFRITLPHEKK